MKMHEIEADRIAEIGEMLLLAEDDWRKTPASFSNVLTLQSAKATYDILAVKLITEVKAAARRIRNRPE